MWRHLAGSTAINRACYFLLNYARPSNFHNSTIFLRPLLAIFFWIMRGKGSKGQAAGVGGSPVSLLAIFFWIMPWKAWLLWLRLGTKTCYFLLNYAWTRTNRWRLPVQTGLLFSFELCHCCYCLPWSPLHRVSCYFLLNYAIDYREVAIGVLYYPTILLFSFELCIDLQDPRTWLLLALLPCYFLLNYAYRWSSTLG